MKVVADFIESYEKGIEMPWVRIGKCNRCGDCCRPETLPERIKAYLRWNMPFILPTNGEPCPFFKDGEPATCLIYENRPLSCRLFPRHPADIEALPRCGYRFIWVDLE
jgi:Fe-S-cluster containining protein